MLANNILKYMHTFKHTSRFYNMTDIRKCTIKKSEWMTESVGDLNERFFYFFIFFSVRLLSVLSGHSVFSSPPQRPMTSDFEGFSMPDFIHYIYFPFLIFEKEPVFSLLNVQCSTRALLLPFYNVFGMTRSLTGDWTRDLLHSKPALHH